ncbi:partial, partial [Paramuricea clavata]
MTGILSTLALLFKHGKRADLITHARTVRETVESCDILTVNNSLLRKLYVKLIQRLGLTFLKPRLAAWRYKRGTRSLSHNLAKSVQEKTITDIQVMENEKQSDENFDVPEDIEDIIEILLIGLKEKDTIVRWSAAKGVGRITGRLPKELADDIVGAVLDLFRKSKVDWKLVDGAFTKQRRLHLVKDRDGLDHCPVTGCEHPGFASQRGCRKHVKIKHGWYYYFDEKPNVSMDLFDTSLSAANGTNEKASRTVPGCSTDNEFARSFSQWLQSSCGGGKSPKQSDISVTRALKFVKFCCDESGDAEEDVLTSPNLIDYALGSPKLLTKFVDSLKEKWGLGQSGQISYVTSISDLLDFRKFNRPPASVLQNFAVTEVYVKRARKCLGKSMRSNWTTELDIETLESRRSWATLSEVQSVIPFHVERYESVLEKCMACSSSVKTGDVTFATRFVAAYMFLKVKGCRPMTYQHLTLRMFESAKRNEGMVDQTIFKTAKKYGFDSVYFDECSMEILGKYIT